MKTAETVCVGKVCRVGAAEHFIGPCLPVEMIGSRTRTRWWYQNESHFGTISI